MNVLPHALKLSGAGLLLLGLGAGAYAQTASAPSSANAAASKDQAVQLSEFQVTDTSPNAYVASETMTGSRVNTKIIDLPYSIVNLTSEFFKDNSIDILDENMTYIGGLTGVGIGGGFTLRGFSATSQMKDGFYRLGRYGLSNIDRVEVIRGPNAAIYGRSSPGGMINLISLEPKKQEVEEYRMTYGSYNQTKNELYATGSVDSSGKTYYVFDFAQRGRKYPDGWGAIHNTELYGALKHDFTDGSHLKFTGEYFLQVQHSPVPSAPIVSVARAATPDNNATTTVVGYDTALAFVNPYGPNSELNRGSFTFTGTYDKQFNDIFSTRIGAYRFGARRWDFNSNTGWGGITIPLTGTAITTTRGSLPSRGEIMEDGGGFQADLAADYYLFNHTVKNKTLLTADLNDYYRWDPTWEYSVNTNPALVAWNAASSGRVVSLTPGGPGAYDLVPTGPVTYFPNRYTATDLSLFTPPGNDITGGAAINGGSLTRRRTTSLGGNLRQQMTLLNDRLIVYAGIRTDNVLFSQRDYTVNFASVGVGPFPAGQGGSGQPGGSVVRRYEHQNKPNAGFNYAVVPNLRVYGSYSEAYFVDQTSRPAVIAAPTYQPFTAKGFDYGIKGSYFDQKLNFTVGGFYTHQYNVNTTDVVEISPGLFTDVAVQDGNQLVRGWESEVSYVISDSLTTGGSFGRVDSRYTFYGKFSEAVGRSVNGVSPENGSAYIKYNFINGPLKGLYFNVLSTYVASTPTQAPNAGDTLTTNTATGVVTYAGHTDAYKLRLPSFTIWTFSAHYKLPRLTPHWDQTIGLTLNNAFDKRYLKTNAQAGDGRAVLFTYTLTHAGAR